MITKIRVTATVIAILILILCPIVVNAKLTPKEGVTIYEYPTDNDFIKIYAKNLTKAEVVELFKSIGLPVKSVEVSKEDEYTIFTIHTSIGEKVSPFKRRIDGKILAELSKLGDVYIYIDKGCTVKGDIQLVESDYFQDLYKVKGYSDITYELEKSLLIELEAIFVIIPTLSFFLSRYYAKKVFSSNLSKEEKLYKIRKLAIFIPIPIALILAYLMLFLNFVTIYDMIIGYFFKYNETLFVIGFLGAWIIIYIVSMIFVMIGYLPYYKALKREEIETKKATKYNVLVVLMLILPTVIWVILVLNLPKTLKSNTEFIVLIFAIFMLVLMSVSPNVFSLFHRAESLKTPLRDEIIEFCKKNGVRVSDVKVLKGLPEKVANAGVSGILHKYVFLTEYLIDKFSKEEIMAVIAHEIGHLKEKHNLISGIYSITFFVVWIYASKFVDLSSLNPYEFMALWLAIVLVFILMLGRIMVYLEFRADKYAVKVVGKDLYIRALSKLAEANVMKRKTGKLYNIFTLHPSIEERIRKLSEENSFS
jgi:STE24 endopeptidase